MAVRPSETVRMLLCIVDSNDSVKKLPVCRHINDKVLYLLDSVTKFGTVIFEQGRVDSL